MTANVTIARPYAKAVFEFAIENGQLKHCSAILSQLAFAIALPEVNAYIKNPSGTQEQQTQLLLTALSTDKQSAENDFPVKNFIQTLAQHKRLLVLGEIHQLFEDLRANHEKVQTVNVVSFSPLTAAQKEKLKQSLSQRLQREISIEVSIDKSLIGGAIIHAGDLVINGSVRDKLLKLSADLVA